MTKKRLRFFSLGAGAAVSLSTTTVSQIVKGGEEIDTENIMTRGADTEGTFEYDDDGREEKGEVNVEEPVPDIIFLCFGSIFLVRLNTLPHILLFSTVTVFD